MPTDHVLPDRLSMQGAITNLDEAGIDAIERVIELTGLDKDSVRVVRYRRPSTLLEAVGMKAVAAVDPQMSMLEMTVPRAYYMLTTVPGLTPLGE